MTMYGRPVSVMPWSKIWMAYFDWIVAAARASLSKRARASSLLAYSASMNLMATRVPRLGVPSLPDGAHPAAPDEPDELVLASDEAGDRRGKVVVVSGHAKPLASGWRADPAAKAPARHPAPASAA